VVPPASAEGDTTERVPYYAAGEIGGRHGEFFYQYAIDPLGTEALDPTRPAFETGTARVLLDAVWRVDGRVLPEPGPLALVRLVAGLLLCARRALRSDEAEN
jgi:hypothetical protein